MKRFAIYFTPPAEHPLTRAAASWLGRDAYGALDPVSPSINGLSREIWRAATSEPRRYGFHATLKPPFRLAHGASERDLTDALARFASSRCSFPLPPLGLSRIARFWALTFTSPCPPMEQLAADAVREFDVYRAAPSEEELIRRRRARLTSRQLEHLSQWGYPYVLDEWRFHMTLTSSIDDADADDFGRRLQHLFAPLCAEPSTCDAVTLFVQPSPGDPFHIVERFLFP